MRCARPIAHKSSVSDGIKETMRRGGAVDVADLCEHAVSTAIATVHATNQRSAFKARTHSNDEDKAPARGMLAHSHERVGSR